MAEEIVKLLLVKGLVVVHGPSGGGKSSIARAGVLTRLERRRERSGRKICLGEMRPGEAPVRNLALAFAMALGLPEQAIEIRRRRCAALASSPHRRVRAGCRMRKPGCDCSCDVRSFYRRGFGRARFHVRVSDPGDSRINDHLSELRHGKGRDHANGRLPVFL